MCSLGSLDLMKNSQKSEDFKTVSEQWYLLMAGLSQHQMAKGKAGFV